MHHEDSTSLPVNGTRRADESRLEHAAPLPAGDDVILRATGLGKCYRTYARPLDRLKQALLGSRRRWFREFWALQDVDLELRRGEALGIVGRNGSGKSTLLQILAGTLPPSTGEAAVRGRVGGLLELGSGFDPEFTGRENARLQGVVLGHAPREVDACMDEIETFAELGPFFDEPVKTYSSGMFVRLAFAVQAVLPPEVLIVDEALSVGDAAFQIKCTSRMRRLLAEGMTMILASHDMAAVRGLCTQAIWIHEGRVRARGCPNETTAAYVRHLFGAEVGAAATAPRLRPRAPAGIPGALAELPELVDGPRLGRWGSGEARITRVGLRVAGSDEPRDTLANGERLRLELELCAAQDLDGARLGVAFSLRNTNGLDLVTYATFEAGDGLPPLAAGETLRVAFELDNILPRGDYGLVLAIEEVLGDERRYLDFVEHAMIVRVTSTVRTFSVVYPPIVHEIVAVGVPRA